MKKETQAGRLRGPGAAGGADPGTPNTTAAKKAVDAVVSTDGAAAGAVAPSSHDQSDAAPLMKTGNPPPAGGEIVAPEGVLPPGMKTEAPDWLGIAAAAEKASITGAVEEFGGEPVQGVPIASYVTHLRVASRSPSGFRRCGRRWGPQAVEVSSDEFSDDEILRLFAEPELIVLAVTGGIASDDE